MKKIWKYLIGHIEQDFNFWHYLIISLFLATCIYLNYKFNFHDNVIRQQTGLIKLLYFFIFYAVAYYFSVLSYVIFYKKKDVIRNKSFWIKSFMLLFALALDNSIPYFSAFIDNNFHERVSLWAYKVINNLACLFTIIIPLLVYHHYYERKEKHFYGLNAKKFDVKPYFVMLLIVLPIIIMASFHTSFLYQYPTYPITEVHTYLHVPRWFTALIYEISYGVDFVSVEFTFRGFLVIGMMTIMGRSAVLSMVTVYCFLHFGKPAGEAISSIFGGYVLGVVAYETKSIWGGIIIHLGVAWTMELAAFLQKTL